MLYQMLYSSVAREPVSARDMRTLIHHARERNAGLAISGVLLYFSRSAEFIQVLEGEEPVVRLLFDVIARDSRHSRVCVHFEDHIVERSLGRWPMGFLHGDPSGRSGWPGRTRPPVRASDAIQWGGNRAIGMRLLQVIRGAVSDRATLH